MTKKILLLSSLFVLILIAGCDKLNDLAKFDVKMNLPAQHFTLTKPELKNSLAPVDLYYDFNVNVNLDSIMQAHGLSNIGIENGKLTKALLTITNPENANLAFINSARVVLFEATGAQTQVAHTGNINPEAQSVELILDAADLSTLIKNKNFNGRIYVTVDPALMSPTAGFTLNQAIQFTVNPL